MPDVELIPDGDEDEPSYPQRATPVRRVLGVVTLVAVLVIGILIGRSRGHTSAVTDRASGVPASSTAAATVAASSEPEQSGVLEFTGVFRTSGSLGSRTLGYDFGLVNLTPQTLHIRYPIDLVGQDGTVIPTVFSGLYPEATGRDQIDSFGPPAHRIDEIQAGGGATLLLSVRVDCANPAVTAAAAPYVRIRLAESSAPADFGLPQLASGFQDAVSQICG